jgi:hypothetical protein
MQNMRLVRIKNGRRVEMKIYDERGKQIGAIDRPEPVEQDGVWYEAVEYRRPVKGDKIVIVDCGLFLCRLRRTIIDGEGYATTWIMRPIPTPTQDQLTAIGKKLDGDRPRECKSGDKIWHGGQCVTYYSGFGQMCRWHMKDDPAKATGEREEGCVTCQNTGCQMPRSIRPLVGHLAPSCKCTGYKPPVAQAGKDGGHTSCEGCANLPPAGQPLRCWHACVTEPGIRRNWIPQPPKGKYAIKDNAQKFWQNVYLHCQKLGMQPKTGWTGEQDVCAFIRDLANKAQTAKGEDASLTTPDGQIEAWKEVFAVCCELGMNIQTNLSGMEDVLAFIRDLAERAGEERYGVEEIEDYLHQIGEHECTLYSAIRNILNPQDGIKAVTNRRGTK